MYYFSTVLMLLVVFGSSSLLNSCSSDLTPKIVFSTDTYEFPEPFIVGSDIATSFSFTNKGNTPLHIQKLDSDCGCVATNTFSDKIAPGHIGEIRVRVERSVGRFRQNVFVYTDDPISPVVHLEVSGVILAPVTYSQKIELGGLEKGKPVPKTITLTNNLKNTVEIIGYKVSNKSISVQLPIKNIPAGKKLEIEVVLSLNDVGLYDESLTLFAKAQETISGIESKTFEMSIQFQGRMLGGIVVLPQHLFLGVLDDPGKSVQKKVQIKTDGSRPFALKKISADNLSVTSTLSQDPQTAHEVELSITPKTDSASSGLVEGEIKIFTTHPDVPEITIPVKAVNP